MEYIAIARHPCLIRCWRDHHISRRRGCFCDSGSRCDQAADGIRDAIAITSAIRYICNLKRPRSARRTRTDVLTRHEVITDANKIGVPSEELNSCYRLARGRERRGYGGACFVGGKLLDITFVGDADWRSDVAVVVSGCGDDFTGCDIVGGGDLIASRADVPKGCIWVDELASGSE